MALNVEIKARVDDVAALRERAERLSDRPVEVMTQEDVFFVVPAGRLKLRILAPDVGQLIYYERQDRTGPKESRYLVYPTAQPQLLQALLSVALGVRGVVRKQRELFWAGNTRIHLDRVEGLGDFMELEVMLEEGQATAEGKARARELMDALGVGAEQLEECAYIDLLERRLT